MTIAVLLVPANLQVREETLDSVIERHAMLSEFVTLEVILEIRWSKPTPIAHGSFYPQLWFLKFVVGPTIIRPNSVSGYFGGGCSVSRR